MGPDTREVSIAGLSSHVGVFVGAMPLVNEQPMKYRAAIHPQDVRTIIGRVRGDAS